MLALRRFMLVLLILLLVPSSPAHAQSMAWKSRMAELKAALTKLLPDVISQQRFQDPKNAKSILENAKKLASLSHEMPDKEKAPDADPSIALISGMFRDEVNRALRTLQTGNKAYARNVLRTIPNFCIACHTRSGSEADLSSLKTQAPATLVGHLEKAEFYTATRQFDRALSEYETVLADPKAPKARQLEWERSVRHAIATAVRVKQDPDKALSIVDRVAALPDVPLFMKENAVQWQKTLNEWKAERSKKISTTEGLLAEAKNLISKAYAVQKYPADHSADIYYLRASAEAHELMRQNPSGTTLADGLYILGVSYEALQDLELWNLHDLYYEACIRKFPHTESAKNCYQRYEQSVYAGYTGSAGVSLPDDVARELGELKKASEPK
jgi:hypothetical protein